MIPNTYDNRQIASSQNRYAGRPIWFRKMAIIQPLFFFGCSALLVGCSAKISTIEITDYREPGEAHQYRESFEEAYYDIDPAGNVNIVLRRTSPNVSAEGEEITQVIYIHTMWRSIPGITVAHKSQINATVTYGIMGDRMGVTFEGAGSVFAKENKAKNTITGTVELARLKPTRKLTQDSALFHHAEISGEFFALRDRRKVVHTINELNRTFNPLPIVENKSSNP